MDLAHPNHRETKLPFSVDHYAGKHFGDLIVALKRKDMLN